MMILVVLFFIYLSFAAYVVLLTAFLLLFWCFILIFLLTLVCLILVGDKGKLAIIEQ